MRVFFYSILRQGYFFLILLFGLSCSLYLNFEDDSSDINIISSKRKPTFCQSKLSEHTIVGTEQYLVDNFNTFLKEHTVKRRLAFIDKVVLWALLQMNLRPDISTPSSRLQVSILHQNKSKYWDFHVRSGKEKEGYPYLHGLEKLLSFYKSKYTLTKLAAILDKHYKYPFYVGYELTQTLIKKKKDLAKNKYLKDAFF